MDIQFTEFEFGSFRINTSDRLLTRNGVIVPLVPKAADTLLALLAAPNRVIGKAELMQTVWPDSFVEEGSLARNIYQIRKALGDHPEGHAYIETVPRRGYRFVAKVSEYPNGIMVKPVADLAPEQPSYTAPLAPSAPSKRRRIGWAPFSFALLAIAAGFGISYFFPSIHLANGEPPSLVPFTTYPGGEYEPAFSPDGSQVAFVWSGDREENYDIYVKSIATGAVRRLTTNPAGEGSPCWSPDGSEIAFVRYSVEPDKSGVYIVSAAGGTERKLTSLFPLAHIFDSHLDWSPDGKTLAVVDKESADARFSVFLVSLETGQRRKLTNPPSQSLGDTGPRFSPDDRTLAFKRTTSPAVNDLYLISLAGAAAAPKRLTFNNGYIACHAWMPDGRELIYSSTTASPKGFWRVPVSHDAPRPLPSLGAEATYLSISRKGNRLAYSQWFADTNIWRIPLSQEQAQTPNPSELISSTRDERSGQYSPDGTKVAFRSDRSGASEIWMSDAEGNNPVQLTSFRGPLTGTPRWSPDGLQIAFDSRPGGNADIYSLRLASGAVRRITRHQAEDAVPSWSADGRWIYFASNRTGQWQVWKVSSGDEREDSAVQVTRGGGFAAFESRDGKTVYYAKGRDVDELWQVPVAGGPETPLIPQLKAGSWGYWAVGDRGIYFIDTLEGHTNIYLYRFQTRAIETIASLAKQPPFGDSGFSVSPNARWIIYTQVDHSGSDIMLVENFH